jgi:hypothetical protein
MSDIFAMIRAYDATEGSLWDLAAALDRAQEDRRKLQATHNEEVEALNQEIACLTLQRQEAVDRNEVYGNDIRVIRQQRDEAMRAQVVADHALDDMTHQHNDLALAMGDAECALVDMEYHRNEA